MPKCKRCRASDVDDHSTCGFSGAPLERVGSTTGFAQPGALADCLEWEIDTPLVTDRFLLYDTVKVLFITGIFIATLGSLLALALGGARAPLAEWRMSFQILVMVLGGLGGAMLLVMLVFFGNRFPARISLDRSGVRWQSQSRRGKWANRTSILVGLLAAKPGTMGAGILAESRSTVDMRWSDVRRVRCHPELCVVSLMNGWRVVLRLHCPPSLYEHACQFIREAAPHAAMEGDSV